MKQGDFAELIGVSPPSVSDWIRAGRLRRGDSALAWLRACTDWLQDEAAGRSGNSPLAAARTRLVSAQADATAMANAVRRREWAPGALIDSVIGAVGRQVHADLAPLASDIVDRCPDLPPEALRIIESRLTAALKRASNLGMPVATLVRLDEKADD